MSPTKSVLTPIDAVGSPNRTDGCTVEEKGHAAKPSRRGETATAFSVAADLGHCFLSSQIEPEAPDVDAFR